jgi:hypothetical protein
MDAPKLNEKLIMEIWDWISFKAGTDGFPAYNQGTWHTTEMLMDEVLEVTLAREPEYQHGVASYQEGYCGTACCVAGYALLENTNPKTGQLLEGTKVTNVEGEDVIINYDTRDWWALGAHKLGLTDEEATSIFSGDNKIEDVRAKFNKVLAARGSALRL